MDKAALFTEITRRNELRRQAQLPLLDVRAEFDHAVAQAAIDEYHAFCDQHVAKYVEFRDQVLAEKRLMKPDFGHTMGGVMMVGLEAKRRFEAWIETQFGVQRPRFQAKNAIVYGQARTT